MICMWQHLQKIELLRTDQTYFRAFRPASDLTSNLMARVGFQYVLPGKR